MWPMILAGAGVGLLKAKAEQEQAERQRIVEMAKARWGALSGGVYGQPEYVKDADMLGSVLGGAYTGASFANANPSKKAVAGGGALEKPELGDSALKSSDPSAGALGVDTNLSGATPGAFTANKLEHHSELEMPSLYDSASRMKKMNRYGRLGGY